MNPERWQQIKRIYNSALELRSKRREAFLEEACAGDQSLRSEIDLLLARRPEAEGFFEAPAMELAAQALARDRSAEPSADLTGSMLLHYSVTRKIGAGGMGEVYQARDLKLNRQVALKILPDSFAHDRERLSRFDREAKLLASLNHPNIAAIYGLEEARDKKFLVLELVEGETLAQRIKKGRLPMVEALELCRQIAEGLEAAHEKGVVHRDLKPANVMIAGSDKIKILDFGLARPLAAQSAATAATQSPTITEAMTGPDVILGTATYMSPEQANGKAVDKRADIWAFGCVLYECLTGGRAFPGDTVSETIASVLGREPGWDALPAATPIAIRKLLERCLRKNPHERIHDVADVRIEIQEALSESADVVHVQEKGLRGRLLMSLAVVAGVLLSVVAGIMLARIWIPPAKNQLPVEKTTISFSGSGLTLTVGGVAISPDGQKIAFPATGADGQRLYLRQLDTWEPRALKGTEGAQYPFFSPDSEWVAFIANGKLLKTPVGGGPTEPICEVSLQSTGGSWGRDGKILFGQFPNAGVWRVPDEGGQPEAVTKKPLDSSTQYGWPELLPGGNAILFNLRLNSVAAYSILTGEVQTIISSGTNARYVKTGHLLYQAEGSLRAVPFDPDRLETRGPSRLVSEGIAKGFGRGREYDVSATGTLVHTLPSTSLSRLVWKDRNGIAVPLNLNPRIYSFPAISPDGRKIAVNVQESTQRNVWIAKADGEPLTRLSFTNNDWFGVFTPDSRRVFFTSREKGSYNIFWAAADGSAKPEPLTIGAHIRRPTSCSFDGKLLLFNDADETGRRDVYVLDVNRPAFERPFAQTSFSELEGVFSPDGQYVAYQSDESGRMEVYVQPYPGPGAKVPISNDGGQGPAWNPRGGELFYESPTAFMAVRMDNGNPAGAPVKLFAHVPRDHRREYDVSPDGHRFLMLESAETQINVITNLFEELKRLFPTGKK
jgi:Tol biopolymer transport system component